MSLSVMAGMVARSNWRVQLADLPRTCTHMRSSKSEQAWPLALLCTLDEAVGQSQWHCCDCQVETS